MAVRNWGSRRNDGNSGITKVPNVRVTSLFSVIFTAVAFVRARILCHSLRLSGNFLILARARATKLKHVGTRYKFGAGPCAFQDVNNHRCTRKLLQLVGACER